MLYALILYYITLDGPQKLEVIPARLTEQQCLAEKQAHETMFDSITGYRLVCEVET